MSGKVQGHVSSHDNSCEEEDPTGYAAPGATNPQSNGSGSDSDGECRVGIAEVLDSGTHMYEVLDFLGKGSYGQVVKCRQFDTHQTVAIKILKKSEYFARQAEIEMSVLSQLSQENPDRFNFVQSYEFFQHLDHTCLVFEMLEMSLSDFLEQNEFSPLPLKYIRPIIHQILVALLKLKQLGIIHTDLKPENLMMVDPVNHPYRIKVIDFGSATSVSVARHCTYVTTRYYRAPEVILSLPFSFAIDMWSLGCIAAELFLGCPLFPGSSEYEQIKLIIQTLGLPPADMLNHGEKSRLFFSRNVAIFPSWRLKTPLEYKSETGKLPKVGLLDGYVFHCVDDIIREHAPTDLEGGRLLAEKVDREAFVSLLKGMLTMDKDSRITPGEGLVHPFLTLSDLLDYEHLEGVKDSRQIMGVFRRNDEVEMFRADTQNQTAYHHDEQPEKTSNDNIPSPAYSFITISDNEENNEERRSPKDTQNQTAYHHGEEPTKTSNDSIPSPAYSFITISDNEENNEERSSPKDTQNQTAYHHGEEPTKTSNDNIPSPAYSFITISDNEENNEDRRSPIGMLILAPNNEDMQFLVATSTRDLTLI